MKKEARRMEEDEEEEEVEEEGRRKRKKKKENDDDSGEKKGLSLSYGSFCHHFHSCHLFCHSYVKHPSHLCFVILVIFITFFNHVL